jgi:hypothetical protein
MNKHIKFAVSAVLTLGLMGTVSGTAFAADEAAGKDAKPMVSSAAVAKDLKDAQTALSAGKYAEAVRLCEDVKGMKDHNAYDEFAANSFLMAAYNGMKRPADAVKALEAVMASKYMEEKDRPQRMRQALSLHYDLKNYDKVIDYGKQLADRGDNSTQIKTLVAQAYYLKNDFRTAQKATTDLVDAQIKAGETPKEDLLRMGQSSAASLNDSAAQARWFERMVAYYPKPEYWQNLLKPMYLTKMPDRSLLQVYRLAWDVNALTDASLVTDLAQLAMDDGSPGEAQAALQKGLDAGLFVTPADKNRNQHLLETAKKQAAEDQPQLPKLEADAASAATGDKLVKMGSGYFGYKQYDKAVSTVAAGIAKGGLKDPVAAQMLLAVAQYKAGKKQDAIASFQKVKGDPNLERVANLWLIRLRS